jgi:ribosome-associated heat shock protein Hsp15
LLPSPRSKPRQKTNLTNSSPKLGPDETIRIDIWLWRARLFKTRALSAKITAKGKVRLLRGDVTARITKPHYRLQANDRLTFMRGAQLIQLEVLSAGTRRGPAAEAETLYRNLAPQDCN